MSANNTAKSVPATEAVKTASERVAEALANYAPKRGIPTWKATGTDAATVAEVLTTGDAEAIVSAWQDRTGELAKLPGSLLSEAIMQAILSADDVEAILPLKLALKLAKDGQAADTGDTLTDNASKAGKVAGERAAILAAALGILSTMLPSQVVAAGPERIAAYVAARDAAIKGTPDAGEVAKVVGSVVNGNTGLAATYGKSTVWQDASK
jgi:hypothetical protein